MLYSECMVTPHVRQVRKRTGELVPFNKDKITNAIFKAAQSLGGNDRREAERVADRVVESINKRFRPSGIPTIEQIQDLVEKSLIETGHASTAKAYIMYRHRKNVEREMKKLLGIKDDFKLPLNSVQVLERRYLLRDENERVAETPAQLFRRVADYIAAAERKFGADKRATKTTADAFYEMMTNFEFLPNSPTLMNSGTELNQLAACFILPVPDDLEGIFNAIKYTAMIHKTAGGTGFCFSYLRPRGDIVQSTAGVASGPVSFMTAFDKATDVVKQGGRRRGANMAVLHSWHPDIGEFIAAKQASGMLENFNISVAADDRFMHAVERNSSYEMINPRTKQTAGRIRAKTLFRKICYSAWKSAEPGMLFIDTINRTNPTPKYRINATNPCSEVPMPDYESCTLGSINISKFVDFDWSKTDWRKKVNWKKLKYTIRLAIQFLDNVIELNRYPIQEIKQMTLYHRRVGLGVMGVGKMLYRLGVRYGSDASYEIGEGIMKFITNEARRMSHELGRLRGSFPGFGESAWAGKYDAMRNATVTSIAPTGTISMIADTSGGIEPVFALSYLKTVRAGEFYYIEDTFEHVSKIRRLYGTGLMRRVADSGTIQHMKDMPKDIREVFVVAYDIPAVAHVRMQAAFQKHIDLAVSKTINMPARATVSDVERAFMLAWKMGCKGITVYRDTSRKEQVLHIGKKPRTKGVRTER